MHISIHHIWPIANIHTHDCCLFGWDTHVSVYMSINQHTKYMHRRHRPPRTEGTQHTNMCGPSHTKYMHRRHKKQTPRTEGAPRMDQHRIELIQVRSLLCQHLPLPRRVAHGPAPPAGAVVVVSSSSGGFCRGRRLSLVCCVLFWGEGGWFRVGRRVSALGPA